MTASLVKIAGIVLLAYVILVLLLALWQRKLIYHPSTGTETHLLQRAGHEGLQAWRDTNDNLIGWKSEPTGQGGSQRAVIVFHGNAGHALHRGHFARGFQQLPGDDAWTVYLFEYPGFGARRGSPSEKHIKQAAEAAFAVVQAQNYDSVLLVGESLGGGVASHIAATHPGQVSGLLLITPFTTLADVASAHFPFFPVRLLLREHYDNVDALSQYQGPVVFLLAERDEVVPVKLGQALHDGYQGPKRLRIEPGATHNTMPYHAHAPWWRETVDFLTPQ